MRIAKINDTQCVVKQNPTFTSGKLGLVGAGLLSALTLGGNNSLAQGSNCARQIHQSTISKENLRVAHELYQDAVNLANPESPYSLDACFKMGEDGLTDYLYYDNPTLQDKLHRQTAFVGWGHDLITKSALDGSDFDSFTQKLKPIEQKMPELIMETKIKNPKLAGEKFDSVVLKKAELYQRVIDAMKKDRRKNYLVTWCEKGVQSIKDSIKGKNLHPENVLLNKDFHSNYQLQAFFVGQSWIRKDLLAQKTQEMLEEFELKKSMKNPYDANKIVELVLKREKRKIYKDTALLKLILRK